MQHWRKRRFPPVRFVSGNFPLGRHDCGMVRDGRRDAAAECDSEVDIRVLRPAGRDGIGRTAGGVAVGRRLMTGGAPMGLTVVRDGPASLCRATVGVGTGGGWLAGNAGADVADAGTSGAVTGAC